MIKIHWKIPALLAAWSLLACGPSVDSSGDMKEATSSTSEDSAFNVIDVEVEHTPPLATLNHLLSDGDIEEAKRYIEENSIDINDYIEIDRGPTYYSARRLLPEMIHMHCSNDITTFLLDLGADPNLPSKFLLVPEYSSTSIPESFDIESEDMGVLNEYLSIQLPLDAALSCTDSLVFYSLYGKVSNQDDKLLHGAIKWNDATLVEQLLNEDLEIDFVPKTNSREILEKLIPYTDGKRFSTFEYGEGGDIFDSDLMVACQDGKDNLVWFMLKSGADPNHCMPKNAHEGKGLEPDEEGMYPAVTPLSISEKEYSKNLELADKRENAEAFRERADRFERIISLLEEYGAKEIEKCAW